VRLRDGRLGGAAALLAASIGGSAAGADGRTVAAPRLASPGCAGAIAGRLDFWIGRWDVQGPGGETEGRNVIEKVLAGCAVLEHWTDAAGGQGKSLYIDGIGGRWKQVWVADDGTFKEKAEVRDFAGGVRFAGEIPLRDGRRIQDRTTLTALPGGRVRQRIEQSADGGATWRAWEGIYAPAAAKAPPSALGSPDSDAIRAVHQEYRDAWLAGDATRVMATLTPDAVLLPSGLAPIEGEQAIRRFWWPGGPPTTIEAFEVTVDEVAGQGDIACARGWDHLRFRTGAEPAVSQHSTYLDVVRRGADGRWRISRRMWSDLREKP
jgi:uncharacterized protein (TIGR02246 family)